ncbi:hypothetical protein [Clostridium beijerinckii]|uniref:Uncharacterized protein n=1 Tax=Clostridium beijerinckii TaxID=1520 RepID=A0AAE5H0S3_CLOBE|nr:hypothetical protein [Clostridium beijerinckii]NSB12310.1 hypothetical protein [Clostridium beijerinckii]
MAVTLAKIEVQVVKDDENRNKIIFISLVPIISVLLILAFIIYIQKNPLEMLSEFFVGDALSKVKIILSQYGYGQIINPLYYHMNIDTICHGFMIK